MNYHEQEKQAIREVALAAIEAGYHAYLSESETYGFFTDPEGSRVVSFQLEFFTPKFSGNYITDRPSKTGTGWDLGSGSISDKQTFDALFNASAPTWAVGNANWRYATLEDHLNRYGSSSRYTRVAS